jgi:hypothetical protein
LAWAFSGPAGGKQNHFLAVNRHKREVNYFACGKNIGVDFRRPCRGQTCDGMLGAMAHIAPTRPTTTFFRWLFKIRLSCFRGEGWHHHHHHAQPDRINFFLDQQRFQLNPPL